MIMNLIFILVLYFFSFVTLFTMSFIYMTLLLLPTDQHKLCVELVQPHQLLWGCEEDILYLPSESDRHTAPSPAWWLTCPPAYAGRPAKGWWRSTSAMGNNCKNQLWIEFWWSGETWTEFRGNQEIQYSLSHGQLHYLHDVLLIVLGEPFHLHL